jgi:hypothetical protein
MVQRDSECARWIDKVTHHPFGCLLLSLPLCIVCLSRCRPLAFGCRCACVCVDRFSLRWAFSPAAALAQLSLPHRPPLVTVLLLFCFTFITHPPLIMSTATASASGLNVDTITTTFDNKVSTTTSKRGCSEPGPQHPMPQPSVNPAAASTPGPARQRLWTTWCRRDVVHAGRHASIAARLASDHCTADDAQTAHPRLTPPRSLEWYSYALLSRVRLLVCHVSCRLPICLSLSSAARSWTWLRCVTTPHNR